MLRSLHIENVAVIRRADVDFEHGFSVFTGETGAGKSMIIDSINLLLGNRTSREIIRTGEGYALVSAVFEELPTSTVKTLSDMGFDTEDGTAMLQRRIQADGRSLTKLNGQTITQAVQKEVARMLVSIHGQADSQRLLQKNAHLSLVDDFADHDEELERYRDAYRAYKDAVGRLEALSKDEAEVLRRCEMLRFQIEDIDALKLRAGEEEALEKERDRLGHLEHVNKQTALILRALRGGERSGALDLIFRAEGALRSISDVVDGGDELSERLIAVRSELEDIAEIAAGYAEDDLADPTERIDRIEARLDAISKLKRKYGQSVELILAYRERAAAELSSLELSDEEKEALQRNVTTLKKAAEAIADELHARRVMAAREITARVTETLSFLDMPKVRFEIALTSTDLGERGSDDAEFLIATNPGEPLLPMLRIASGGELSRIMLALRSVLNDKSGADTVVFDEIDTGISGKTSRKVGIKLLESAKFSQVLCVTHSAQIASLATTHYRVVKSEADGRAETDVEILSEDARIEEIARILGGIEITEVQREAARQMIEEYRAQKGESRA